MAHEYDIKILKPGEISKGLFESLVTLIVEGGQIERHYAETGLKRASLVGLILAGEEIITSCSIKNPNDSYCKSVFEQSGSKLLPAKYQYELGYIVTNPDYQGQGFCQKLLRELMASVIGQPMFATTRKPSMAHVLTKIGFEKEGDTYKNDLSLFVRG